MKKDSRQIPRKSRRAFLRDTATAGAGAAIVAVLPGVAAAGSSEAADTEAQSAAQQQGYRLTQHVLDYYKTLT